MGDARRRAGGVVHVVGAVHADLLLEVPSLPGPGETVVGAPALRRGWGGKGANQALAAARAGARAHLHGAVGDDEQGAGALASLRAAGVVVDGVARLPDAPTGTAVVLVDEAGENLIAVAPGAGAALCPGDLVVDAGPGDVVLASLELPLEVVAAAVGRAATAGARVVLNAAPLRGAGSALLRDLLDLADPVVVNAVEASALRVRPPSLVETLGAGGARWGDLHVAAPRVRVLDTTGAGDAACGALAAALAAGAGRREALEAAVSAGARAAGAVGAQGG